MPLLEGSAAKKWYLDAKLFYDQEDDFSLLQWQGEYQQKIPVGEKVENMPMVLKAQFIILGEGAMELSTDLKERMQEINDPLLTVGQPTELMNMYVNGYCAENPQDRASLAVRNLLLCEQNLRNSGLTIQHDQASTQVLSACFSRICSPKTSGAVGIQQPSLEDVHFAARSLLRNALIENKLFSEENVPSLPHLTTFDVFRITATINQLHQAKLLNLNMILAIFEISKRDSQLLNHINTDDLALINTAINKGVTLENAVGKMFLENKLSHNPYDLMFQAFTSKQKEYQQSLKLE
ncbi:hypothetical protein L3V83_07335 [Thiotrichales bacterium 19X7-9]|nr:hypothetical protein [Thiotrichales bacterium 19X7-9]